MLDLASFSQAIHFASEASIYFDPNLFSQDLYWLQWKFLTFALKLPEGSIETYIDKACRLGALLFLKAILQEFPHSTNGPSLLVAQLRECLDGIQIQQSNSPLLLWLCLIGGSFSRSEARAWFVNYLVHIRDIFLVPSYDDFDVDMSRILGLRKVFGKAFGTLWSETLVRSGGNFDYLSG